MHPRGSIYFPFGTHLCIFCFFVFGRRGTDDWQPPRCHFIEANDGDINEMPFH